MADTYSAKPFISYDGVDSQGIRAEVRVVKGYGRVADLTDSSAGKSKQAKFSVDNTKYLPSGWSRDEAVLKKLQQAQESGEPIHFRLEVRRKDGVDRTLPIDNFKSMDEVRENAHKSLAAVKFEDDAEWTISKDAATRLDEDPVETGGVISAYSSPPEELRKAQNNGGAAAPRRGRSVEAAPFETYNFDGSLNPGSMAVAAPLNLFSFILELEKENNLTIAKDVRKVLARDLLDVANRLQQVIYKHQGVELTKPELTAGSHTRARALVFEAIRSFAPLTEELIAGDEDARKKWKKTLLTTGFAMWEWALEVVEEVLAD